MALSYFDRRGVQLKSAQDKAMPVSQAADEKIPRHRDRGSLLRGVCDPGREDLLFSDLHKRSYRGHLPTDLFMPDQGKGNDRDSLL